MWVCQKLTGCLCKMIRKTNCCGSTGNWNKAMWHLTPQGHLTPLYPTVKQNPHKSHKPISYSTRIFLGLNAPHPWVEVGCLSSQHHPIHCSNVLTGQWLVDWADRHPCPTDCWDWMTKMKGKSWKGCPCFELWISVHKGWLSQVVLFLVKHKIVRLYHTGYYWQTFLTALVYVQTQKQHQWHIDFLFQ